MKIKAVCELTGLTDRTIRYYIEEQLISPAYTENYLGRKSFDFSPDDVEALHNISVLRKFDFTIEEIRDIEHNAENSKAIIQNVKTRIEQAVIAGQMQQRTLSHIEDNKAYSLEELAKELSNASKSLPKTDERIKRHIGQTILTVIKTAITLLLVWLPIGFQVLFFLVTINIYAYPTFHPQAVIYMTLSVLPSLFILLLGRIKSRWKKAAKSLSMILCAVSLFCSFIVSILPAGMLAMSETTDIVDYRDVDADCLANRNSFVNELFPTWPHYFENVKGADGYLETVYLDAHYYYRYLSFFDYTYDIYAEWPLEKEEFEKEVARVQALYKSKQDYTTVQTENYTCFFLYDGDPPFEEATDNYTYYIFAYDETNLTVRYIVCNSLENGVDQPYYLSLDW